MTLLIRDKLIDGFNLLRDLSVKLKTIPLVFHWGDFGGRGAGIGAAVSRLGSLGVIQKICS